MVKKIETKVSKPESLAPKRTKSPTSNPVVGRTVKPKLQGNVALTNISDIDSIYNNLRIKATVQNKYGVNIGKLESAKRKSDLILELLYAILNDSSDLDLAHEDWIALTTRAYGKYMDRYGPIVDINANVIEGVKELLKDMIENKRNYILPEESEAEKVIRILSDLRSYEVNTEDVGIEVSVTVMTEALENLESSIKNFKDSPFPFGSPQFSRLGIHTLATKAYIQLGFSETEAKSLANLLFTKM